MDCREVGKLKNKSRKKEINIIIYDKKLKINWKGLMK